MQPYPLAISSRMGVDGARPDAAGGCASCRTWSGRTPADVREGDWVEHEATGRRFRWGPMHVRSEALERLRATSGDALGDSAVAEGADGIAWGRLMEEAARVPWWVDFERVGRGCDAFIQVLPLAGFSLLHLSLVGGFAAPAIVKTLKRTGQLCPPEATRERARRRVLRTLGMVERAMCGGLRPGEPGWQAVLDTRLVHAKVSDVCVRCAWRTAVVCAHSYVRAGAELRLRTLVL